MRWHRGTLYRQTRFECRAVAALCDCSEKKRERNGEKFARAPLFRGLFSRGAPRGLRRFQLWRRGARVATAAIFHRRYSFPTTVAPKREKRSQDGRVAKTLTTARRFQQRVRICGCVHLLRAAVQLWEPNSARARRRAAASAIYTFHAGNASCACRLIWRMCFRSLFFCLFLTYIYMPGLQSTLYTCARAYQGIFVMGTQ